MQIVTTDGVKIPGSITTDKRTGRLRVRVMVRGKRVSLPGSFDLDTDAIGVAAAFWQGLAEQQPQKVAGLLTINEWGLKHLNALETDGVRRSVDRERSRWKARVGNTPLGKLYIDAFDQDDVRSWLKELVTSINPRTKQRRGKQTVANALNLLRVTMEAAVEAKLIRENPVRSIRLPKFTSTKVGWDWLRAHEVDQIVIHKDLTLEDRILFAVAVCTGLRKGELWGLRKTDIDFEQAEVVVAHSYDGPTKGGRVRRVPLIEPALIALRFWLDHHPCSRSELVFPQVDGSMRSRVHNGAFSKNHRSDLVAVMRAVTKRSIRFHDLRHTCASHLLQGTWAPKWMKRALRLSEVAKWLGHTKIATTERYAHLAEEALREQVKRKELGLPGAQPLSRGTPNLILIRNGKAIAGTFGRQDASGRGVAAVDATVSVPDSEVVEIVGESGGAGGDRTRVKRFCKPALIRMVSHSYVGPRPLSVQIIELLQAYAKRQDPPVERVIDVLMLAGERALEHERAAAERVESVRAPRTARTTPRRRS